MEGRLTGPARLKLNAVTVLCLSIAAAITAGYMIPLLVRSAYEFQANYNEGFMLYQQADVSGGHQLYGARPGFTIHNYPPLSFYLLNAASGVADSPLLAGRLLETLCFFLTAAFSGAIVLVMTRSWGPSILGFLLVLISIARYAPTYVAVNEPQLIADAILLGGVLLFFARAETSFTAASAFIIGTALFVKHSALAFPAAITLILAMKDRRRFVIWSSMLFATAVLWTGFCFLVQGRYFFDHLMGPRSVRSMGVSIRLAIFLADTMLLPLIVATVWVLLDTASEYRSYLAAALGFAIAYGVTATRSEGAMMNHWFDLIFAVSIAASLAWARALRFWREARWGRIWVLGLFPIFAVAGDALLAPPDIVHLRDLRASLAGDQSRFLEDVEYERTHDGPAICENLSLCYFAGKPFEYDAFNARVRIVRFPASADAIVRDLQAHRYTTVQLDADPGEQITAEDRLRFPAVFMKALLENYHIDRRNNDRVFFVPNAG